MATWFDESRLDDETALGAADLRLRTLAESGSRVRREAGDAAAVIDRAVAESEQARPRAVIAAGPDSRLLRAVLEPWCPVPFVAWPGPALPGWSGSLDLVVVLAPDGRDIGTASAVAEAVRRGCQVVVACPAGSMVAEHAAGRYSTIIPTVTARPARHRRRRPRLPAPRRPRPERRARAGRPGPRRRGRVLLAAPRPLDQPGQDAGHRPGRRQPARLGRLGARGPRRPPGGGVDPAHERPHRAGRRRRAPAAGDRGGAAARRLRRPLRRGCA